ncbi:MAG: peptidylprolyl isomerase [Clostridia bacterium]
MQLIKITMENDKTMVAELYEEISPITVANFVELVKANFYDSLIFHRVISGFMIQGGDPKGTGMGGSKKTIKGEFSSNGIANSLKHTRGVLSMARSNSPNSASSQFFIMHKDSPHLDGLYASFGKVITNLEVLDEIASTKTDYNDKPIVPQVIKKIELI